MPKIDQIKNTVSVKIICQLALLSALEVVLNRLLSINTQALKIGFAFAPIVMAAVLFGPIHAAIVYAVADSIGAILFPTGPFMIGITFSCAIMGLVFGLFLRPLMKDETNKLSVKSIILIVIPVLINCLLLGLLLNSYWLSLIYTKRSFIFFFNMRVVEYSMLIPIQIVIIPFLINLAKRLKRLGIV